MFTFRRSSALLLLSLSAQVVAQSPTVAIDIPSQNLSSALLSLSQQTGIQVAFTPASVSGKHVPALQGDMTPTTALNTLLQGTGLTTRRDGDGRFQVIVDTHTTSLEPVRVTGEQVGERIYTQEEIAATPTSNRDLSALVATNPAVRTNNQMNNGANRGSMAVEDISFHGSSPYQNQFQIDGVSANNRLNPASQNPGLQVGRIPSSSQAYAIDTAILEQVRVYDSSIPVEYGQFTGGVVDARLRRPSGENRLKVDYRWNTSNMTKQNVSEYDEEQWEQGEPGFSPEWKKRFYTLNGEVGFTDTLGATLSASRRESTIQRYGIGTADDPFASTQSGYTDRVDNFLGKFTLKASPATVSDLTLKLSDRREDLVSNGSLDSAWTNRQKAHGIAWNIEHSWDKAHLQVQAGWDDYTINRDSNHESLVVYQFADRRPQYSIGGFGKEEKRQQTFSLGSRLDVAPFQTGALEHNVYAGVQAQRIYFNFERYSDLYSYRQVTQRDGSITKSNMVHYLPGTVDRHYTTIAAYAADRIQWGRVALTASARVDRDTLLDNINISPRTRLDWDAFGTGQTILSGGWSRYYGSDILNIALQQDISKLAYQVLDSKGQPVPDGSKSIYTGFDSLKTPYDDEWALSLTQRMGSVEGKFSYVHRNGRDQVTKVGDATSGYEYVNDGKSQNDSYTLSFATLEPWSIQETRWTARADFSYQRSKRNANLVDGYEDTAVGPDEYVYYNGRRIRTMDLPPGNFNQPYKARLQLTGYWPRHGLTWDNTVNWQSSRDDILVIGRGPAPERLTQYESGKIASFWTWDTRVTWQPNFAPDLTMSVDVLNILNRTPKLTATNPNSSTDRSMYRVGREIWLQVGYQF